MKNVRIDIVCGSILKALSGRSTDQPTSRQRTTGTEGISNDVQLTKRGVLSSYHTAECREGRQVSTTTVKVLTVLWATGQSPAFEQFDAG